MRRTKLTGQNYCLGPARSLELAGCSHVRSEAGHAGLEEHDMRNLFLAVVICLAASACQTPQQSAGTATGVVAGAVVGGPVGAVVGGVAGATVTAPGGPLSPGYCYVHNRRGQLLYDRAGRQVRAGPALRLNLRGAGRLPPYMKGAAKEAMMSRSRRSPLARALERPARSSPSPCLRSRFRSSESRDSEWSANPEAEKGHRDALKVLKREDQKSPRRRRRSRRYESNAWSDSLAYWRTPALEVSA